MPVRGDLGYLPCVSEEGLWYLRGGSQGCAKARWWGDAASYGEPERGNDSTLAEPLQGPRYHPDPIAGVLGLSVVPVGTHSVLRAGVAETRSGSRSSCKPADLEKKEG